jgi:tRNA-2-methylthio-N6-dimethylallyladenosine synthase
MAETENVMPHLHMPLQSGSDRILQAMRRSYRRSRYLTILEKVREAIPEAAITTDIIVGFPGESEEDFQATLDLCDRAEFSAAYTFQYSKRPGTPAAQMEEQIPAELVKERYDRLHAHQSAISLRLNQRAIGKEFEILVMEKEGKDHERLSGRSEDFRLIHFDFDNSEGIRPGDFVTGKISDAKPFYLLASGAPITWRKSRGGDAFEARKEEAQISGVLLGMPALRNPVPVKAEKLI